MSYNKICFDIPTTCDSCYEFTYPVQCLDILNVPCSNLTPGDTYYLYVRDKFNNVFEADVIADPWGGFNIDVLDFPLGIFQPIAGKPMIFLTTSKTDPEMHIQPMTIYTIDYTCVLLAQGDNDLRQFDDSFDLSFL